MKLKTAQIKGFRSFVDSVSIRFDATGLVFVAGINQVEPALGANGAGKSSIFEAIYWCLFGKTSRGLKAGAIKSWGSTQIPTVILELEVHGQDYTIFRSWGPNKLLVGEDATDLHEVDQETLERLLGVSPKAFLYSVFFAQFSPSFLDLGTSDQMRLFSEVLNLDLWDEASTTAGKSAREAEASLRLLENKISGIRGQYLASQYYLDREEERLLNNIRTRYSAGVNAYKGLMRARAALAEAESQLKKAGEGQGKQRRELKNSIMDIEGEKEKALKQQATWQAELRTLQGKKPPDKTCPTCGGPLNAKQVKEAMEAFEAGQAKVKKLKQDLKTVEEWLEDWSIELKDLREALEALTEDTELTQAVATNKQVLEMYRQSLDTAIKDPIPTEDQEALEKVRGFEADLLQLKKKAADAKSEFEAYQYWQKEFKELRLYLIEESLTQLEVESNSALHELGLTGWRVEFDVESEKKTGGTKTGFSVLIYSPTNDELVPWEAWSGGESQRLRLAVTMGLASLIASRTGADPNIEFWDEPSTWLSTSGITDLMQTLKSRAENTGKQIWIADHRTLEYGGFSKVVTVTKTLEGSTLS